MTHVCTLCKKELPDTEFYRSNLIKHKYHCKKCTYEHYGKKNTQKYVREIKSLPEKAFDLFYGGYVVSILNYARPEEYKYTIKGTNGVMIQTNDVDYFRKKLGEIL